MNGWLLALENQLLARMEEPGDSPDEDKAKGVSDLKKALKPPNRKKYDEDLEQVMVTIREKELALKSLNYKPEDKLANDLKASKAEKEACGEKRKEIDIRLKALNSAVNQKMQSLSKLQCNLHYRNEDKINEAIRKLDWQLKHQNFKLSEEKKIVAEIDSLKRSKKVLSQFLALKKEIDGMRDQQRRMREERDNYFKQQSQLKSKEEALKRSNSENKVKYEELKNVIDDLYDQKRKIIADFKQQEKEFQDMKGVLQKQKKRESLKRREDEKKAKQEAAQREIEEIQSLRDPYVDERNLCNTLIIYLQRHISNSDMDLVSPATTPASTPAEENKPIVPQGPAEELEDGALVLLKREEINEYGGIGKRTTKRSRRSRKSSMIRPINHTPQIFSQFESLTLNAPSCVGEISASIEQLMARKAYYEQLGHRPRAGTFTGNLATSCSLESFRDRAETWAFMNTMRPPTTAISEDHTHSEAGNSATESAIQEMSRQASKTESQGSNSDMHNFDIMEELVKASNDLPSRSSDATHSSCSDETIKSAGCVDDCSEKSCDDQFGQVNSELDSDNFPDKCELVGERFSDCLENELDTDKTQSDDKSSKSVCDVVLDNSTNVNTDCDITDEKPCKKLNTCDDSFEVEVSSINLNEKPDTPNVDDVGACPKNCVPPDIFVTDACCREIYSLPVDEKSSLTSVESV